VQAVDLLEDAELASSLDPGLRFVITRTAPAAHATRSDVTNGSHGLRITVSRTGELRVRVLEAWFDASKCVAALGAAGEYVLCDRPLERAAASVAEGSLADPSSPISTPDTRAESVRAPLVLAWWAAEIAAVFLNWAAAPQSAADATTLITFAAMAHIGAAGLAICVIRVITRRQEIKAGLEGRA
jgi:hypothetical protein